MSTTLQANNGLINNAPHPRQSRHLVLSWESIWVNGNSLKGSRVSLSLSPSEEIPSIFFFAWLRKKFFILIIITAIRWIVELLG